MACITAYGVIEFRIPTISDVLVGIACASAESLGRNGEVTYYSV